MKLPNFLIIGAAKSGTTALYAYLKQHPQIFMSPFKEPRFFAFQDNPPRFQGPRDQANAINNKTITSIDKYLDLFKGVTTEIAIGEASPAYIHVPGTAERIQRLIPNVKLIAILRHPAERAFSSFLHLKREGYEPLDFGQALIEESNRTSKNWEFLWQYKGLGFYYEQLNQYYRVFDQTQIRVYLYDDLQENPENLMRDIFEFLNVDSSFVPDTSKKINTSGIPKSKKLKEFLGKPDYVKSLLKPFFPKKLRKNLVYYLQQKNLQRPSISLDQRTHLTREYHADILKLQGLIKRDLSHWLEC